jgi:hypothetical protein
VCRFVSSGGRGSCNLGIEEEEERKRGDLGTEHKLAPVDIYLVKLHESALVDAWPWRMKRRQMIIVRCAPRSLCRPGRNENVFITTSSSSLMRKFH